MPQKITDEIPWYRFVFNAGAGKEKIVKAYITLHNTDFNAKFWDKTKAVPSKEKEGKFDVFLPIDDKQYRILYPDSTKPENIDYSTYKQIIEEAKTKNELLIIKAIYGLAYP